MNIRSSILVLTFVLVFIASGAMSSREMNDGKKDKWPEHLGELGTDASVKIQEAFPNLRVSVLPEDAMVTMDFRLDRVRVFVDSNGRVSKVPSLG